MFRRRANTILEGLLAVVNRHIEGLESLSSPVLQPSEKLLSLLEQLPQDFSFLEEHTHLFALECRQDRSSTFQLVQKYDRQLQFCLDLHLRIVTIKNLKLLTSNSSLSEYLLALKTSLPEILDQLHSELNYFPQYLNTGMTCHYTTGTHPHAPSGGCACAKLNFQEAPATASFQEPQNISPAPQSPPAEMQPLEELLSQLRISELHAVEIKSRVEDILQALEQQNHERKSSKSKRTGPQGKNSGISSKEQIYVLLLANLDLLFKKYIGSSRTYDFFALACGCSQRDAAGYIRYYRKDITPSKEDEKYELEGNYDELKIKALDYLGPLPGVILKLVKR